VIYEQRQELSFIPEVIGMLSRRLNSHALRGRRRAGRGEAQSRERVKFIKKHFV
jgi:hypothetical protein